MPSKSTIVTHVTYPVTTLLPDSPEQPPVSLGAVRVHSSKAAALEFAVDEGATKYVPVRAGETLADAILRYRREREPKATGGRSTPEILGASK